MTRAPAQTATKRTRTARQIEPGWTNGHVCDSHWLDLLCWIDVGTGKPQHLSPAPVIRCAECKAELREEQAQRVIRHDGKETHMCTYCERRICCYGGEAGERTKWRLNFDRLSLDVRIAAVQPAPEKREPHDWNADDAEYEL